MNYDGLMELRNRINADENGERRGLMPHEIHRIREKVWRKAKSTYNEETFCSICYSEF